MRIPLRASLFALLLASGASFSLGLPRANAEPEPANAKALPAFRIYNGQPQRHIFGTSEIHAGRGQVELEPALQGDLVHHELRLVNATQVPWNLENIQMCSGCMLDGATRSIAPGQTGSIRFVIPTDALGGQTVDGTIRADTGAPAPSTIEVGVRLEVREFAALHPYRVWLKGRAGEPVAASAIVVPNDAYPFSITGIRARKGVWIETSLRETTYEGRKAWAIDIRNTRKKPGPYQDVLFVQTDHPERAEFKIRVEGRIE